MISTLTFLAALLLPFSWGLASQSPSTSVSPSPPLASSPSPLISSRRAFVDFGVSTASLAFLSIPAASAYEFVDVGGGQGSAVTQAMNIQAYETNNRLEKGGFQLDTPAEQSKSLSAALSDYSYEPSSGGKNDKSKASSQATTFSSDTNKNKRSSSSSKR